MPCSSKQMEEQDTLEHIIEEGMTLRSGSKDKSPKKCVRFASKGGGLDFFADPDNLEVEQIGQLKKKRRKHVEKENADRRSGDRKRHIRRRLFKARNNRAIAEKDDAMVVEEKKAEDLYKDAAEEEPEIRIGGHVKRRPGEKRSYDDDDRRRFYIMLQPKEATIRKVREAYDQVFERYEKYVETEGKATWSKCFTNRGRIRKPLAIAPAVQCYGGPGTHEQDFVVCGNEKLKRRGLDRCPRVTLKPIHVMPRMNHFSHIQHSIRTNDERYLSHIPYVGEVDHDEDAFTQLLLEFYDEGIHGTEPSYGLYMNDRILYETLLNLEKEMNGTEHSREMYNAALHELFPNKCSARALLNKAVELSERYDQAPVLPFGAPRTKCWQSKRADDDPDAEYPLGDPTSTGAICHRCYQLNCLIHNDERINVKERAKTERSTRPICSFLCCYKFAERMAYQEMVLKALQDQTPLPPDLMYRTRPAAFSNADLAGCMELPKTPCKEEREEEEDDKDEGSPIPCSSKDMDNEDSPTKRARRNLRRKRYNHPFMQSSTNGQVWVERPLECSRFKQSRSDRFGDVNCKDERERKRKAARRLSELNDDRGRIMKIEPFEPPADWQNPQLPEPFWEEHDEALAKQMIAERFSICDVVGVLRVLWAPTPEKMRNCYEVYLYLSRQQTNFETEPVERKREPDLRDLNRQFRNSAWKGCDQGFIQNGHRLAPCSHEGRCSETADPPCRCYLLRIPCTKFCGCSKTCTKRFPGCRCAPGKCRTKMCQCYYASWECDPDVCGRCCGEDVMIPGKLHPGEKDEEVQAKICQNLSITRGKLKKLYVNKSSVAGWGAYTGEKCFTGELISEYVGEIISADEAERRGHMYDKLKLSYIFSLNDDEVVDATRCGNVSRFINHSTYPNCLARVYIVNGDHRIGIYARRDIEQGEELFFNYGYTQQHLRSFLSKEREVDTTIDALCLSAEQTKELENMEIEMERRKKKRMKKKRMRRGSQDPPVEKKRHMKPAMKIAPTNSPSPQKSKSPTNTNATSPTKN